MVFASPDNDRIRRAIASIVTDIARLIDRECAIAAGEHPFINRASLVLYQTSESLQRATLTRGTAVGNFRGSNPLTTK